jgi:hypothetical protein
MDKLEENNHICLGCALNNNYVIKLPVRISKNKCQVCKKSKEGASLNKYKVRETNS